MKLLLTALALSTLVAAPAVAQSYDPDLGSGNIAPGFSSRGGVPRFRSGAYAAAPDAYAWAPGRVGHRHHRVIRHERD